MEWQDILNQALQILVPAFATLIAGWFAYLGNKLKNTYQTKLNNETAQAVVKDVVQFVEQVSEDLHGKEKLDKAIEHASEILKSKGINLTEKEINTLIESAVYGLNQGFTADSNDNQTVTEINKIDNIENQVDNSEN